MLPVASMSLIFQALADKQNCNLDIKVVSSTKSTRQEVFKTLGIFS